MRIAILTFDGFNEIDSFVASYMINRAAPSGWKAEIACATPVVVSGRGVRVSAQQPLEFAREADAVVVGSGKGTAQMVEDAALMSRISLDPRKQLVVSQCSGALVLAKLGVLRGLPACTDRLTAPLVKAAGLQVLEQPFFARGNVATAGGCLASHYLATWVLWRLGGRAMAEEALSYVAPVGEEAEWTARALRTVDAFIDERAADALSPYRGGAGRRWAARGRTRHSARGAGLDRTCAGAAPTCAAPACAGDGGE